jgi:hypothetical protein
MTLTCDQVRSELEDWPALRRRPTWGGVVRHTWSCAACRAELVAVVVVAERVGVAVRALPGPPPRVAGALMAALAPGEAPGPGLGDTSAGVSGEEGADRPGLGPRPSRAWQRLARAAPYLPPLLRLAADPWALLRPWLSAAEAG